MHRKIFINLLTVLLLGVAICGFLSMQFTSKSFTKKIEERLISNTYLAEELLTYKIVNHGAGSLNDYLLKIKNITGARVTVIDRTGKVIGDSDYDTNAMENHLNRPEVQGALSGRLFVERRLSDTLKVNLLYSALPIYQGNEIMGVIRLAIPLSEIDHVKRNIYGSILTAIIIGVLIASLLGYRITLNIINPIRQMTYIASKISKGEFDKKIYLNSKDEFGELAKSINNIASRLDETINSLKDKNVRMEAILSSVVNGIIAIDNFERILFINPAAYKMFNISETDVVGKHFLQILRNNQIDNFLKMVINEKKYVDTEINLTYPEEKNLKIFTNPIKYADTNTIIGIIVTIQDITEIKRLENMRTEFVANVSHELKTPLTSIKGFVETLKEEAIENKAAARKFLDIIEVEADRLARLISDILSLSELENKKNKMMLENINIKLVINEVVSILNSQAAKKNITIEKLIDPQVDKITGDSDKLKQMLINLVDNAIKYTPVGGLVKINCENYGENIVIKVIDNGIGISKEHIPRLFERFYRVDKARSRKIGGTGLGLAIVKHIVKLFNGDIEVQSELGKGTEFKVVLPKRT